MILLPWEIFLNTNFQKCSPMFIFICHCGGTCLIRIWHVNNSKQSKYQTTACSLFFVLIIYTLKVQMCYETFVLICHCGRTCLIRIIYPKQSTQSKCQKLLAHCFLNLQFILLRSKCVIHYYLHLFTIMYNYGLSSISIYG